ncbi:hypothetical protein [Comamonas sp.]|uniref:hypothetical protein n=1 Tax=Comamonas sp. TaxID=34028 RepID=UPI0028A1ACE5|nr:hypothetical protein [Comamonas sp.]
MGIVVFYLRNNAEDAEGVPPDWQPQWLAYSDQQMSEALAQCQRLRADPRHAHVVMSSELRDMVGQIGVAAVEDGRTPDGEHYDWSKAGRAGMSRRNAMEPPKKRGSASNE